jgi:hypothetical protein
MTRSDLLAVFFKLLGVYALISGVADVIATISLLAGTPASLSGPFWGRLVASTVWLAAGLFLVKRTSHCLRWCGEPHIPV